MTYPRAGKAGLWLLLGAILVLGHGIVLYHVASKATWFVLGGLVLLLVFKHVGLGASIYAIFKRGSRGSA